MLGQKLVALFIMAVPAVIAVYGIKVIRDVFYLSFNPEIGLQWGKLLLGLILFLGPVLFIAGFILHHDRKRNRVQPRFMTKEEEEEDE